MPLILALWAWLLPLLPNPDFRAPPAAAVSAVEESAAAAPMARERKVLLIGIDGLRPDALLAARAPNLRGLIAQGAFTPAALADSVTRSGPGWASVFTGVWHGKHRVFDNSIRGFRGDRYPAFFARLKEKRPDLATACFVNWAPIRDQIVTGADLSAATGDDDSVAAQAVRLLGAGNPDVVFLHFDAPDHAGHKYGFSRFSPPYAQAVERVDDLIGKVLRSLEARPDRAREDWLILCTTDHGGSWRHHGQDIPSQRHVFLIVSGEGSQRGTRIQAGSLVDVAPTVFSFLGVPMEPSWGWEGHAVGLRNGRNDVRLAAVAAP